MPAHATRDDYNIHVFALHNGVHTKSLNAQKSHSAAWAVIDAVRHGPKDTGHVNTAQQLVHTHT